MMEQTEYYKKYRPKNLNEVLGQPEAVKTLQEMLNKNNVPRCLLLTGPSGCGKTSLARILKDQLGCGRGDFVELNCADTRGIETFRNIKQLMSLRPMSGKCRIWLLDEVHRITGDSQSAVLKMFEDTPNHVYFFLATTDPHKLLSTIRTRTTEIKLKNLTDKELDNLVNKVLTLEKQKVDEEVLRELIRCSEGSARKALVFLNQIVNLTDVDEQLSCLGQDIKTKGFDLAKKLIDSRTKWNDITPILSNLEEEPETVRYIVLGYANSVMMKKPSKRCYLVICAFESNFYDSKKAGLTRACWEVISNE